MLGLIIFSYFFIAYLVIVYNSEHDEVFEVCITYGIMWLPLLLIKIIVGCYKVIKGEANDY